MEMEADYQTKKLVRLEFNPFQINVSFLYPPKTSENQRFADVFEGYRKGTLAWNELNISRTKMVETSCKMY